MQRTLCNRFGRPCCLAPHAAQQKKDEAAAKAAETAAKKLEAKRLAEAEEAELTNSAKKKTPNRVKAPPKVDAAFLYLDVHASCWPCSCTESNLCAAV